MNGGKNKNKIALFILAIASVLVCFVAYRYTRTNHYTVKMKDKVEKPIVATSTSIRLLLVGDMMLDRNVRNIINEKGFDYFFGGVKDILKNTDVAVANLEGSFTDNPSVTTSLKNKTLQFTFDPSLAMKLSDLGFSVLGLANNHTLNFGNKGLETSRRYIGSAGIQYYGDPDNNSEISTIVVQNGIRVGFIGYNEFSYKNLDKIDNEITRLRSMVDVLIVTPHWGNEYIKSPTETQRKLAYKYIDSGVDVVVGTHSHIIGDIEEYKGKKIYYSLGNFAFDQYFSEETQTGLMILMNVEKDDKNLVKISYNLIKIKVDREGIKVLK